MSDFTHVIDTKRRYELLVENADDNDINNVLLFTKKEKITPVFKALSAEFRDKLRFNVIPILKDTSEDMLEIMNKYGVTDLPAIIISQTYNAEANDILEETNIVKAKVSNNLAELTKFMSTYARKVPKEELEESQKAKEDQADKAQ